MTQSRGELIRNAREARGISQETMADKCKITQQTYSNIERDVTRNPSRRVLKMLSKELDIPFETLLLGEEWPEQASEAARTVAREYDQLPPQDQVKIMAIILSSKKYSPAEARERA